MGYTKATEAGNKPDISVANFYNLPRGWHQLHIIFQKFNNIT